MTISRCRSFNGNILYFWSSAIYFKKWYFFNSLLLFYICDIVCALFEILLEEQILLSKRSISVVHLLIYVLKMFISSLTRYFSLLIWPLNVLILRYSYFRSSEKPEGYISTSSTIFLRCSECTTETPDRLLI